jgi:hypothetical protein
MIDKEEGGEGRIVRHLTDFLVLVRPSAEPGYRVRAAPSGAALQFAKEGKGL